MSSPYKPSGGMDATQQVLDLLNQAKALAEANGISIGMSSAVPRLPSSSGLTKVAPKPLQYCLYYKGASLGLGAVTYSDCLDLGVDVMKAHPDWDKIEVRKLSDTSKMAGAVWRNPLEGRLIKSKLLG